MGFIFTFRPEMCAALILSGACKCAHRRFFAEAKLRGVVRRKLFSPVMYFNVAAPCTSPARNEDIHKNFTPILHED